MTANSQRRSKAQRFFCAARTKCLMDTDVADRPITDQDQRSSACWLLEGGPDVTGKRRIDACDRASIRLGRGRHCHN